LFDEERVKLPLFKSNNRRRCHRPSFQAMLPNGFDAEVDRLVLVVETGSFVFRRTGWVPRRPFDFRDATPTHPPDIRARANNFHVTPKKK
jgi:hypothetical protein